MEKVFEANMSEVSGSETARTEPMPRDENQIDQHDLWTIHSLLVEYYDFGQDPEAKDTSARHSSNLAKLCRMDEHEFDLELARETALGLYELQGTFVKLAIEQKNEEDLSRLDKWRRVAGLEPKKLSREPYLAYSQFVKFVAKYLPALELASGTIEIVEAQLNILRQEVAREGAINLEVTRPVVVVLWDLVGEELSQHFERMQGFEEDVIRAWSYTKARFNRK